MPTIPLRLPKRKAHRSKIAFLDIMMTLPGNQTEVGLDIPDNTTVEVTLIDLDKRNQVINRQLFTVGETIITDKEDPLQTTETTIGGDHLVVDDPFNEEIE